MLTTKRILAIIIIRFYVVICSKDHWPLGTYTLPKPKAGCPNTEGFTWKEAWRFQDLENDANQGSKFSLNFHMDAKIMNNDVIRGFCTNFNKNVQEPWPEGSYCIYRNSNYCPPDMIQGFIDWYDEQDSNKNKLHSYLNLPDGLYFGPTTRILYCCHTRGYWYEPIELPTKNPFYLLPYGSQNCQRVIGAISSLEYIIYDTEDAQPNRDEFNGHHVFTDKVQSLPKLFYCYYEGCQYKLRDNSGSFTSPNFPNSSYPDFQYCSWSITVNITSRILLKFETLYVPNCKENSLNIYDGDSDKGSAFLARFCGENATSGVKVMSKTNNLYITFKSGDNSEEIREDLSKKLRFHAEYESFQTATPVTPSTSAFFTTHKIATRPTASVPRVSNNTDLTTTINAPGAAKEMLTKKEILTKNIAYFGTVTSSTAILTTTRKGTSKTTTKILEDNTYDNGKINLQSANNQSWFIYLFIILPIITILILLVVVGILFYWRRNKKKDAITITINQSKGVKTAV